MCRPGGRIVYRPPQLPTVPHKPQPKEQACPLTGVEVSALIEDFCTSVTVRQRFKNVEESPIEAVYQFPLDEKYCICDFTAEIDGKVIKGTCKEKEEAKDIYDDAISEGHGAYLLEQDSAENMFKVNVGNLPPGKEVLISITYVTELSFDADSVLQWSLSTNKLKDGPLNPYTRGTEVPALKLKVELDMTSNIRSLSSSSHPISFEFGEEPTKATVILSADNAQPNKDFLLSIKLAKPHQPCVRVQQDPQGNYAAMAALYPEIKLGEDEEVYTEMIFVVDRSGSMSGSRINQVRDTMQIFLRSLSEGTMFNIVGFGTRAEYLFSGGSVEYNDKNLDLATKHVADLKANLGGTNILAPLQRILQSKTIDGYPRQLFILTDGEVSNTQECINFVRQNSHTTRVFTFGIGNEASQQLVKGMAQAGEGSFEFILPGENMEAKVMKQLKKAMQPAFTDLSVDWGELAAQQAPYRLPPLFTGGRMIVYSYIAAQDKAEADVTLKALTALGPFETSVHLKLDESKKGTLFHQLGAKRMIRDLEEGRSFMHNETGSLIQGKNENDIKNEMIRLSTRYGVLCKHTAFVAVEEREEATEGTMQVRKIDSQQNIPAPPLPQMIPAPLLSSRSLQKPSARSFGGPPPPPSSSSSSMSRQSFSMAPPPAPCSAPPPAGGLMCPAPPPAGGPAPRMRRSSPEKERKKKSIAPPQKNSSAVKSRKGGFSLFKRSSSSSAEEKKTEGKQPLKRMAMKECQSDAAPPKLEIESFFSSRLQQTAITPSIEECSDDDDDGGAFSESDRDEEEVVEAPSAEMRNIILKQKASGSWILSDVAALLGKLSGDKIKKGLPALTSAVTADVEALWATAVVMVYLQIVWPRQQTNWDLVVKKAKRWVAKQAKSLSITPDVDWEAAATSFVKSNV